MPKRKTIYQYGAGDSPLTVASQFGITPNQLLEANPGGAPFSVGQNILIPQYQYSAPIGPQPFVGPQPSTVAPVTGGRGTMLPTNPAGSIQNPALAMRGRSYNGAPPASNFSPTGYGTDDSWYRPVQAPGAQAPATVNGSPVAAAGQALGKGDFYGYERDPETGRSVRVVKNSANSSFLSEKRWDPQARRYVSIGKLLKQGKLDLKGNWHRVSRNRKNNERRQEKRKQDLTLSNSLISLGASAG